MSEALKPIDLELGESDGAIANALAQRILFAQVIAIREKINAIEGRINEQTSASNYEPMALALMNLRHLANDLEDLAEISAPLGLKFRVIQRVLAALNEGKETGGFYGNTEGSAGVGHGN